MASLAEQLVRQLGVRPEHLRDLRLNPRNWAPAFRSGMRIQQTQDESSSSDHSGTGGECSGKKGAEAAPGTSACDGKGSQTSGNHQNARTFAKQAASKHGHVLAPLDIQRPHMRWVCCFSAAWRPMAAAHPARAYWSLAFVHFMHAQRIGKQEGCRGLTACVAWRKCWALLIRPVANQLHGK